MSSSTQLSGVYAILHQPSGRAYVGSSKDIFRRWRCHANWLNTGKHHAAALLDAWLSDGATAFTFVVLEQCAPDALQEREQEWLDSFEAPLNTSKNTHCPMFDPAVAARVGAANKISCKGRFMSAETRKKIGDALRGRIISEATRAKLRGRRNSLATRAKLSAALQGHPVSDETRAKMRGPRTSETAQANYRAAAIARTGKALPAVVESNRRRWREGYRIVVRDPALWRARLSASHMGKPGQHTQPHTEETRRKMSNAQRVRMAARRSLTSLITEDTDA